ncbi:M24 family metallopeptidase [Mycobacterium sp. 663a-19]|uniref:M24 family metallopeptidase n=1 Tax=Mycobacterium sp. 663a-19 TaxID=2986148 RepID=UPI002D1F4EFC|nr:M24 family metallopeptidase [Mycobacterium sp. 663a-19]MEB3980051.1 M24 family metallopeptidase [Mycobacterium sp. 663a-19]
MDDSGVDLLIVFPAFLPADAMWIAGQPGAVLFPRDGEPRILLGGEDAALEITRPPGWIGEREFVGFANGVLWGDAVAAQLAKMGLAGRTIAIAGMTGDEYLNMHQPEGYLNYTTIRSVVDALPTSCKVIDGTPILSMARYVKSAEEIDRIQESVRLGETVADRIRQELRPGRAQAEVFAAATLATISEGKLANFGWCPGRWGEPRTRMVGPPPGVVEAGLYLATEIVVPVAGYAGQIAQAFVVGEPNDEAKRLFEINRAAFEAARNAMRPGATWGEVVDATSEAARGSGCFVEFILHGCGTGPLITPYNSHENVKDDVLVESTTFILKPSAVPDGVEWSARSWDVSWGDMVVVRPDGAQRLGTRPVELLACR